jgi:FkbM family methyltransferase
MATKLTLNCAWNPCEFCKDEVCIDIGANCGVVTAEILRNGARKVYCIEAGHVNSEALRTRFAGDTRVTIYEIGVSDEKTTLKNVTWLNAWVLGDPDKMGLPVSPGACDIEGYKRVDIEMDTIDNLFKDLTEPVGFIKIDVEHFEMNVCLGAETTIKKYMPVIFFENKRNEADHVKVWLENLGYSTIKHKSDTVAYKE